MIHRLAVGESQHRIKVGSIMEPLDLLMGGEKADVFYCDPPWGPGTIKQFETRARKKGENVASVDYQTFLTRLFEIAKNHSKNMIFIEYGEKWKNDIISHGRAAGLKYWGYFKCKYRSGNTIRPNDIHVFYQHSFDMTPPVDVEISDQVEIVKYTLSRLHTRPTVVLDPCMGLGATAVAAAEMGLSSCGIELSADRASKAAKRLEVLSKKVSKK
jgi:hypothetical protein